MGKIALVCTGLGSVYRGYERFTQDLFNLLYDEIDVTLFKGAGSANGRQKTLPHVSYDNRILRVLPLSNPYFFQHLSYAAFLIPALIRGDFSLVHYSEPGLGNLLYHARRLFRLKYRLLFSNGVGLSPAHCRRPDHLHELTELYSKEALASGIPQERISTIPYGFYSRNFLTRNHKLPLREKYSIPLDKTVVLSVAAVNRTHKRIDYLLRELSQLDDRFFLVMAGQVEDRSLVGIANALLPYRHRFLVVPFDKTPELYALSDLFVHTALEEGFCLALVEAMCAKLPVFAHDSPHFRWILGSDKGLSDLSVTGNLAEQIRAWIDNSTDERTINSRQLMAVRRFDWENLKKKYLEMYDRVLSQGHPGTDL